MEGNWVLKIYINHSTPKKAEAVLKKWKSIKYKGNYYIGSYVKKPRKEIKRLQHLGIKYDCYRIEYERANNYRQVFFSRTIGPYTCRYCNKKLVKNQIYVDHIIPVAKAQKTHYAKVMLAVSRCQNVNDIKNLAPACRNCNLKKSDKMGLWTIRGWFGKYRAYWIVLNIMKILCIVLMLAGAIYILKQAGIEIF